MVNVWFVFLALALGFAMGILPEIIKAVSKPKPLGIQSLRKLAGAGDMKVHSENPLSSVNRRDMNKKVVIK